MYIIETGTPILGMDLVTALNLQISGGHLLPVNQPTCAMPQSSVEAAVEPSTDFGYAKGFVHKVKIRSVRPVQQKLRRLPLSDRDAVSAELRYLENHGIIEKIDSSEWVSPIVVTQKKTGGYMLSSEGLFPDDTHIKAILKAPAPSDAPSLWSFLGLTACREGNPCELVSDNGSQFVSAVVTLELF
ncbi:gypsy-16 si [Labeo rohita]|uniref:Gypsy-16 si n=1 Tax=Labeo rohita TaxID=84645 RepID=A0A498MAS8_LABRO|nr:gypsy-16 si [Labeo rohita]